MLRPSHQQDRGSRTHEPPPAHEGKPDRIRSRTRPKPYPREVRRRAPKRALISDSPETAAREDETLRRKSADDSHPAREHAVVVRAATVFAEETKPVPTGKDARMEMHVVLRVLVLIRLTRFC